MRALRRWLSLTLICLIAPATGRAMVMLGGKGPVTNVDWALNSEKVANLPSRFNFWDGPPGGETHFNFSGTAAQFQTALDTFATIKAPRLELIVNDGVTSSSLSQGQPVFWEFAIWSKGAHLRLSQPPADGSERSPLLAGMNLEFGKPLPPPKLTLYLGKPNPVKWSEVHVPAGVTVVDQRLDSHTASGIARSKIGGLTEKIPGVGPAIGAMLDPENTNAPPNGTVKARVHDLITNLPLDGALIELGQYDQKRQFQPAASAKTDRNGSATISGLAPGSFVIRISHEGYAPRMAGRFQNFARTLGTFDDLALAPGHPVSGRIVDAEGHPLAGATVGIMGLVGPDGADYQTTLYNERTKAQTDQAGRFTIADLPAGKIVLRVDKPGFYYFSMEGRPVPSGDVQLTMARSCVITGKVAEAARLKAGQNAYVRLDPVGERVGHWSGDAKCEPDGSYRLEGVPADTYTVKVIKAKVGANGFGREYDGDPANIPGTQITLRPGDERKIDF